MKDRSEKVLFHLNKIRKAESQKEFQELSKKKSEWLFQHLKLNFKRRNELITRHTLKNPK
jgi:hypothetical protein